MSAASKQSGRDSAFQAYIELEEESGESLVIVAEDEKKPLKLVAEVARDPEMEVTPASLMNMNNPLADRSRDSKTKVKANKPGEVRASQGLDNHGRDEKLYDDIEDAEFDDELKEIQNRMSLN